MFFFFSFWLACYSNMDPLCVRCRRNGALALAVRNVVGSRGVRVFRLRGAAGESIVPSCRRRCRASCRVSQLRDRARLAHFRRCFKPLAAPPPLPSTFHRRLWLTYVLPPPPFFSSPLCFPDTRAKPRQLQKYRHRRPHRRVRQLGITQPYKCGFDESQRISQAAQPEEGECRKFPAARRVLTVRFFSSPSWSLVTTEFPAVSTSCMEVPS